MNYPRIALCGFSLALLAACRNPEPGLVMSSLSDMLGDEVLVTTSHPIALTSISGAQDGKSNFDTATYLRATLKDVDRSGLLLKVGDREVWVGHDAVVSVVGDE